MKAAADAVACLTKNMLGELKSYRSRRRAWKEVTACCLILLEHEYKQHLKWDRAKKMMGNVDGFMTTLQEYDGRTMPDNEIKNRGLRQGPGDERRGHAEEVRRPRICGRGWSIFMGSTAFT